MFDAIVGVGTDPARRVARQRVTTGLEQQEAFLVRALGRMRLAETLADVPGGADWQGPAERAFGAVRDDLRRRAGAAVGHAEHALAETRATLAALRAEAF